MEASIVHRDIAVLGGGIVGLSVALRLAHESYEVVLVAPRLAHTASASAGAMLGVFSEVGAGEDKETADLHVAERLAARRIYDQWYEELTGTVPNPGIFVIANPDGADDQSALAAIRDIAHENGEEAVTVDWRDIDGLSPENVHPVLDAIWLPSEASVDTALLMSSLWRAVLSHKNVSHFDATAHSLEDAGDRVIVKLDNSDSVSCDSTVLCAGTDTARIAHASQTLNLDLPALFSGRGVSMVVRTKLHLPTTIRTPNRAFACGLHVVPRVNENVYIGATNRLSTTPEPERAATISELEFLTDGAQRQINPLLRDAELVTINVGHRPVAIDRMPLIGRTRDPRVLVASGTYRNGILLAPRVAETIANQIRHGDGAEHPYSPLREVRSEDVVELTGRASRSIVTSMVENGSAFAPGRRVELEQFVATSLAHMLSRGADRDPRLTRFIERLQDRAPMEEVLPLLFDSIVRQGQ